MKLQKTICVLLLALAVMGAAYSLSAQYMAAQAAPQAVEISI